ncbi:N-acetylmuramoyl-L-alanine amidase [Geobacter sp. DSM 9736]|uniref:N-acetylmuramoyl-L-alanine amidase n=1 Tax=Geobacter sp. DSM 9736 TaxID=1277350 RepID=UPI000B613579|nr:N-acetylmuramoyl-L-alanine amidase [Geobacter sp. DSM 9736]SNB45556.1 N-acetylmuramoyl-L-alanine amidase [Geobacter sp. DSM 9736]
MRRLAMLVSFLFMMILPLEGISAEEKKGTGKKEAKSAEARTKKKSTPRNNVSKSELQKRKGKGKVEPKESREKLAPPVPEADPVPAVPQQAVVKELRHWSNPDYTRIAITLDKEAKFESHRLPAGKDKAMRLYFDIKGAHVAPGVKDLSIGDGLLNTARIAQFRADTVRVVLDIGSIKDYKIFTFSDPFRIIVDVKGDHREEIGKPKEEAVIKQSPVQPKAVAAEEKPKAVTKTGLSKIRRIVVDPGHGGHDPGAVGPHGVREKDVVLQISLKLAKKLREELGLDVVMTRSTDVFLELQERTAIANQVGADLFVSVHANAAFNRTSSGIETYYLNLAKTEKAAQLAAKENGTSLEKVSLLQAVLFDLMANYKINDSAHLAEEVQKALHRKVNAQYTVKNLGVKQGPFYVLVGATMPSILVETAFLSNEKEEERLTDDGYQERTAEGILEGIKGYISTVKVETANR